MKIRVLGCHGGELPRHRTTCFLIDGRLTIDGGAITSALELEEILEIDDIFLTHSHFDHVKDVPMMTDLLVGKRDKPVVIHGPPETMEAMDKDVFNNRVWPDFRIIPTREKPVVAFQTLEVRKPVTCQGLRIRAIPVHHPVYSVGYIIEGRDGAIAFSGDTGPTDELWKAVNATPNLKALFLELSFPNSMQWLADISGHLTPRTVMSELAKLDRRGAKVYLYHLKPAVIGEVKAEVRALRLDYLHVCELDEVYNIQ
ncbi:MAG TPA: 3',5'-cyclic-nucleotide phosphodiesterase [Myxococcales bacterium]|jgi:ribonuclease BN (tRNA processing enzyme)|nr:3',5'-cyclic-nucleotide phosphodiesterase [Myxococcales bacterium]